MSPLERFEQLVRDHQDAVYTVALRLLAREADALDVVQTTFLRAWQRISVVSAHPAPRAWLRMVAANLSLNHLQRYRSRWRLFSEMTPDDAASPDESAPAREAAQDACLEAAVAEITSERLARLRDALLALPDSLRVPLVLHVYEDLSYRDIADRLGVSMGKVKTDIHRAKAALRTRFASDEERA